MNWIGNNYSVHENVAVGNAGLYYYYRMMSKSLFSAGAKDIHTPGGDKNWADEMSKALIAQQQPDGSWVNTNGAWMENDFVLVTAYCVRALTFCRATMEGAK
jgi:squalene-hopene/tetraprenyl-beta-curcumene cyclase